jgi:Flp pilus assembly protein TadD
MGHEAIMLAMIGIVSTLAGYLMKQNASLRKENRKLYGTLLRSQQNEGQLDTVVIEDLEQTDIR